MPRWDFLQRHSGRDFENRHQADERPQEQTSASVSVGRGPSDGSPANQPDKPQTREQNPIPRSAGGRIEREDRGRAYSLRDREIQAMTDVGTFRTVDLQDLKRFAYAGDERAMNHDFRELRAAGLIEEKTLLRAHKEPRKVVALTAKGQRIVRRASGLPKDQALYHGFVKPREARHDAAIYRLYQQESARIEKAGGKVQRVILDFELKRSVNHKLAKLQSLPASEQAEHRREIAEENSLPIVNGKVALPDLRLEYEGPDQELGKVDLELVTGDYHAQALAGKAQTGFAMYGLPEDAARLRPQYLTPKSCWTFCRYDPSRTYRSPH